MGIHQEVKRLKSLKLSLILEDPNGNHLNHSSCCFFVRRRRLGIFPLAQELGFLREQGDTIPKRCPFYGLLKRGSFITSVSEWRELIGARTNVGIQMGSEEKTR